MDRGSTVEPETMKRKRPNETVGALQACGETRTPDLIITNRAPTRLQAAQKAGPSQKAHGARAPKSPQTRTKRPRSSVRRIRGSRWSAVGPTKTPRQWRGSSRTPPSSACCSQRCATWQGLVTKAKSGAGRPQHDEPGRSEAVELPAPTGRLG